MKFKVLGKSLILTDYSHKIIEGENSFDTVEISVPRYYNDCDISKLCFRFSETSDDSEKSAVQILRHEKCDEKYIYLKGTITSDFSSITGKVTFILTGVNDENVVAKFQSDPFTVSDDISLDSLPNKITAEQIYDRTHLEAEKAIEAAERAEKASQTPAPAEIYPATEEKLGGVKVDGQTITASEDGTISASTVIMKTSDLSVQVAHPNNFLIYDNAGLPSVMVAVPKFYLDEVINGASHTIHPAFVINGIEQDVVYISKYLNVIENGRAYSLPMKDPAVNVNFDQAWNYCKAKGAGWHLITNAEWSAIALWCIKNGTLPKGNNNYGCDFSEVNIPSKSITANYDKNGKTARTLTGSGRESWYHDGTFAGISDMNGNVWEWISGMRLDDGEIQILANNDAADWNNSCSADSVAWKAIMPDGSLVVPGTLGTLKWDYITTGSTNVTNSFHLNTVLEHPQMTYNLFGSKKFGSLTAKSGVNIPEILYALALFPSSDNEYGGGNFWFKNNEERIPIRGGSWATASNAGVFGLYLNSLRINSTNDFGFRCAYYGNI